jgi:threonyl-tRNA synthetase
MDDVHIYAREDQIFDEVSNILDMMVAFYKNFNFEYEFRFATRPEQRAGTDEMWDKAEKDLEEVLKKKGIKAGDKKGDGAFYGPKIDMHIKDALGRDWQLATVQLDFHMPQAFDLKYVNEKGEFEKPVMIHRAIFGSFERFIGILTEHFQGAFPLWLNPIQITLLPITDEQNDFTKELVERLKAENIRVEADLRNERLQAKVRDATLQKVPYLGIIGKQETESGTVSVRTREGKDLGKIKIADLINKLKEEIDKKV